MAGPVTDPALLAQLNASQPVTDPALLAQLNGETAGQQVGNPDPSMMDLLKAAVRGVGGAAMQGVKGLNTGLVGLASIPANAGIAARNLITGEHTPTLNDVWKQYSDSSIPEATDPLGKLANVAGELAPSLAVPMPGGPAAKAVAGPLADSVAAARGAGYKLTPSSVTGDSPSLLEKIAGPKDTAASFSRSNVKQMVKNVADQFGLPPGTPMTHETMDAVRADTGKAYGAIADLGPQFRAMVDKIKELRSDANGYYRQLSSNYDHDVAKKADAIWEQAQALDQELGKQVTSRAYAQRGQGTAQDLYEQYLNARKVIAQTHDVDKAIVDSRGELNPNTFSKLYGKEKPLSGALQDAGRSAQAFKPSFMTGSGRAVFPWDYGTAIPAAGIGAAAEHFLSSPETLGAALALGGARFGARKLLGSNLMQDMALLSPAQKKAALAESLLRGSVAAQGQE